MTEQLLTVADVAKLRDVNRVSAYRWLLRNAKSYLRRDGRFIRIRAEDYAIVSNGPVDPRIERKIASLDERVTELERRTGKHASALQRLHML
jgi:hypothetical protein